MKLKKQFNAIRREHFPWTWEVTKNASDQPFLDLGKAFAACFEGLKSGNRKGRPRFKSKKRSKPSFYLANDQFVLGDHRIWIPKLGWVNMAENLVRRIVGRMLSATNVVGTDGMFHAYSAYPTPRKRKATRACGEGHVGESHQFFEWSMQGVYGERWIA